MSIKLMAAVWESDLPTTDRLVLLCLADHANDEGYCWPSVGRLMDRTGLTDRGVQKAVKRLSDAGYIEVEIGGGRGNKNVFRVHEKPRTAFTECDEETPNVVPKTPNVVPKTPNVVPKNPEPRSGEPLKNPKRTPNHVHFDDFWNAWPEKRGKANAQKAWAKIKDPDARRLAIDRAQAFMADFRKTYPSASPLHASTYLNQRRWEDLDSQQSEPAPNPEVERILQERMARREMERSSHV